MSSTAPSEPAIPAPSAGGAPWLLMGLLAALLILAFAPVLQQLVADWYNDEDMGHGFFVPVVAGYIAWQKREELLRTPVRPCAWGVALVFAAGVQMIVGRLGVELFVARTAFPLSVTGVVLAVWGAQITRGLLFPLFLLLFMIPIPNIIYNQITFPLQIIASQVAEAALQAVGIPVLRDGNVLELPSQTLSVVEACSGIRSLLSLSFLSLVYGHLFDTKSWMRWVLLAAAAPIAILTNAARVTLTGVFSEVNPELAKGLFHSMEGWVVFVAALVLLVLFHGAINRIWGRFHASK